MESIVIRRRTQIYCKTIKQIVTKQELAQEYAVEV